MPTQCSICYGRFLHFWQLLRSCYGCSGYSFESVSLIGAAGVTHPPAIKTTFLLYSANAGSVYGPGDCSGLRRNRWTGLLAFSRAHSPWGLPGSRPPIGLPTACWSAMPRYKRLTWRTGCARPGRWKRRHARSTRGRESRPLRQIDALGRAGAGSTCPVALRAATTVLPTAI